MHRLGRGDCRWSDYRRIPDGYWTRCRRGAAERGLAFEVTIEDAWAVFVGQGGLCVYSGIPLDFGVGGRAGNASLDRRDSSWGYTGDNIQWVDKRVNQMKMDLPEGEFLELCSLIAQHRGVEPDRSELSVCG